MTQKFLHCKHAAVGMILLASNTEGVWPKTGQRMESDELSGRPLFPQGGQAVQHRGLLVLRAGRVRGPDELMPLMPIKAALMPGITEAEKRCPDSLLGTFPGINALMPGPGRVCV